MKRFIAMLLTAVTTFCAVGISALAQNAISATVYDGVSISQMEAALRSFTVNGQTVTIVQRATQAGNPYLVMTAPGLRAPVNIGGIESSYRGQGAGIYAGVLIVNAFDRSQFAAVDLDEFNRTAYYAKAFRTPNSLLLRSDRIAAGGTTYNTIRNAVFVYLKRTDDLFNAASGSTVSYAPDHGALAAIPYTNDNETIEISLPAISGDSKILSYSENNPVRGRIIEELIDAVAN